jgi:hypothetical protein
MRLHVHIDLVDTTSGGLDYDFDQNSNYPSKNANVLISTAGLANLFEKSG